LSICRFAVPRQLHSLAAADRIGGVTVADNDVGTVAVDGHAVVNACHTILHVDLSVGLIAAAPQTGQHAGMYDMQAPKSKTRKGMGLRW